MVQLFRAAPQFFRQIRPTLSDEFISAPEDVIGRLSFSHICEIEWIDDEYYYPDLIFYNRIGHFSLIVELKDEPFSHENFGQLNSYVSYWKENEMHTGDNPPVGLLLCTKKGKKMVEYAKAGMDNKLFVSTYQLQLPDESTLEKFLLRQLEENQ